MIEGEPGVGKSFVALDFVARVTAGLPWPAAVPLATATPQPQPAQVLLVSRSDDDPIINRRLPVLGAAGSRVARLGVVVSCRSDCETGERRPLELPFDLPMPPRTSLKSCPRSGWWSSTWFPSSARRPVCLQKRRAS